MTTRIETMTAAITLRGEAKLETTAATEAAKNAEGSKVKACMTAIATAYQGSNVTDDMMKSEIKQAWYTYATAQSLVDKSGKPYSGPDACPLAVVSDYITFARAGQKGTFAAADKAATEAGGKWYQNARDLIRRNAKDGIPLTVETLKAMAAAKAEKAKLAGTALDALTKHIKRVAKDFGLDLSGAITICESKRPAAPVVAVVAPAPATPVPVPVAAVPTAPEAPMNISLDPNVAALLSTLSANGGLAQLAAFMAQPKAKGSKK